MDPQKFIEIVESQAQCRSIRNERGSEVRLPGDAVEMVNWQRSFACQQADCDRVSDEPIEVVVSYSNKKRSQFCRLCRRALEGPHPRTGHRKRPLRDMSNDPEWIVVVGAHRLNSDQPNTPDDTTK